MPIYEFYCPDCHTVFSFFSAAVDTAARPDCPRCRRRNLERKPSTFATLTRRAEGEGDLEDDPFDGLDESKIEGAMGSLMREMEGLENEEDPRSMGRLMRRFSELSGLEMGERMEEMVARMEAGEDPEGLEQELGDDLDGDGFDDFFKAKKAAAEHRRPPLKDDELYFL